MFLLFSFLFISCLTIFCNYHIIVVVAVVVTLYKTGEYTLANQVIDCNNTKFSVSRVIGYNSKGQMKAQTPMNTGWMDIPPDSNFEYVAEAVCSYPHI